MTSYLPKRLPITASVVIGWVLTLFPSYVLFVLTLPKLRLQNLRLSKPLGFVLIGFTLWLLPLAFHPTPLRIAGGDVLQALFILMLVGPSSYQLSATQSAAFSRGLTLGTFTLLLVSCFQTMLAGEARAQGWLNHPNVWAMQAVSVALFQLTLLPSSRWSLLTVALCCVTTILTGSRTALLSLLIGSSLLLFITWRHVLFKLVVVGVSLFFILFLLLPSWRQSVVQTITWFANPPEASHNLFFSSENLVDGVWQSQRVQVTPVTASEWRIQKASPEGWARVQQETILFPGEQYSLSGEFLAQKTQHAGFWAVGSNPSEQAELIVDVQGQSTLSGPLKLINIQSYKLEDTWQRLEVTFQYTGKQPLRWWLGVTPDQSDNNQEVVVRSLQLEQGEVTPYQATPTNNLAAANAQTRLPAFKVAWQGFLEKPILGQGLGSYASYYALHPPGQNPFITGHAHNLFLQTLFERGVTGLLGMMLVFAGLWYLATERTLFSILLVSLLVANLLDYTLWSSSSIYLLSAAVKGLKPEGISSKP